MDGGLPKAARGRPQWLDAEPPTVRHAGEAERGRFLSALAESGIGFVRRYSGGTDIDAACGLSEDLVAEPFAAIEAPY